MKLTDIQPKKEQPIKEAAELAIADDDVERPYGITDERWEGGYKERLKHLKKIDPQLYRAIINGD